MRGSDFWHSPCGYAITNAFHENFSDILVAIAQRAFDLRDVDPAMSEHMYKLADALNPERVAACNPDKTQDST